LCAVLIHIIPTKRIDAAALHIDTAVEQQTGEVVHNYLGGGLIVIKLIILVERMVFTRRQNDSVLNGR